MRLKKYLKLIPFVIGAHFVPSISFAETTGAQGPVSKWEFSGYIGSMSINEQSAAREFIDSQAWLFGFSGDYDSGLLLTSLAFEFVSYDDNAGFNQVTEDNFGNTENSSSSASGFLLSVATGPKYHFGPTKSGLVYGQVGAAGMFGSERSISNCSDCYSESIEIEGGLFLKAGVLQNVSNSVALGLNMTQYIGSDDLDSSINVVLSSSF